eukprot:GILK01000157.1.p1 GENE.GILK01000157.1~~GILK01000157.1.p1  ORF type:complete len:350 (-),score=47.11 GILK01000157.1:242-1219(-)
MKSFLLVALLGALCVSVNASSMRACAKHSECDSSEVCHFSYQCDEGTTACRSRGVCFDKQVDDLVNSLRQKKDMPESFVEMESGMQSKGMNLSTLTINAPQGQAASMILGSGDSVYSVNVLPDGSFAIMQASAIIIQIDRHGNIITNTDNFQTGSLSIGSHFIIDGFKQWRLVVQEDFSKEPLVGWSNVSVSECGGLTILGGYCKFSMGEVSKQFLNITKDHTQLRIVATYHFIDAWEGETGYMKVNNGRDGAHQYVWTERYDQTQSVNAINICGNHHTEGRFSSPIDLVIPHTDEEVTVTFGSTLDQDPCDESFGISGFQLYVR